MTQNEEKARERLRVEGWVREFPNCTLASGEGRVLLEEIDRLREEIKPLRQARQMGDVLVRATPALLALDMFSSQPLHVMLTDNGDGTHMLTFRESDELHRLRAELAEARKDTARLDAVERHGWDLYPKADNRWAAFGPLCRVTGATPREVIDAAIAARGEG